ncbi:MAG: hypothetical protein JWL59_4010 [Chthoniobacteraceae bacterium]|nr:hypothetical protein [Chthoniobacteraceae bacterium]
MRSAFTLLEILTVLVVMMILVTLLIPALSSLKNRAELASCTSNLKSLYVGANSYVQEQGHWPQVGTKDIRSPVYTEAWVAALARYGVSRKSWICPTMQRLMKSPDYEKGKGVRVDYFATPFGDGAQTPYKYMTQPWFIERGNVHGNGNLVIFTDGSVVSLNDIAKDNRFTSPPP